MQALGERLIGLSREALDGIALGERLKDAVLTAQSIRSHGALRRQKQLIGKLMRNEDPVPIRAALDALGADDREARRRFREAEHWRDRIVRAPDKALAEFLEWTGTPAPAVEECARAIQTAANERDLKAAKRRLFRAIHGQIAQKMQDVAANG